MVDCYFSPGSKKTPEPSMRVKLSILSESVTQNTVAASMSVTAERVLNSRGLPVTGIAVDSRTENVSVV